MDYIEKIHDLYGEKSSGLGEMAWNDPAGERQGTACSKGSRLELNPNHCCQDSVYRGAPAE